ncbi:MAG TPA: anthranilate phosphoribosyltransferase [Verrucomicrobiae bacterium]|nr:anthranilate phosphoribosyltransferase [Verrucomicrobiae bacterium]
MLELLTQHLTARQSLTELQICEAVEQLVDESVPVENKAEFLSRLAHKGETGAEIAIFARELRARAIRPLIDGSLRAREILDVVGTGGDRLGTFNISTAAALVAAAAGVLVAKHGNRASTSSTGSADVLEALGIPWDLGPDEAVRSLQQHGFAFFFAPKYHPAFRHIGPARRLCAERGQTTIFNILGPLLNPACPSAMLVGVPRLELCEPLALVLQQLGIRRAMVVCGTVRDASGATRYLDELSPLGPTRIAEFYHERALTSSSLSPDSFPLQPASLEDLRGGDREVNATIIRQIFSGKDRGPRREAVLLNASAALFVAGAVRTMTEGWELAAAMIDTGQAQAKLEQLHRP